MRKIRSKFASLNGMKAPERILVWLLRLVGAVMLTALGAVFMPSQWMNAIHQQIGLGDLPDKPIVGYLTRSVSVLYALHGALLLFLAGDVRRYRPVVRFLALAGLVFGVLLLGIDCAVKMPLSWTAGEGPFVIVLGAAILWLSGRRHFPSTAAVPVMGD
jgi:peptidoglycan/LPS O-acetylase OafA/YrhL